MFIFHYVAKRILLFISHFIDLLVEFVASHMMKKFPLELYHQCIGVLQRLLCYQKRCRVRLGYQWRDLWTALINLLKFLTTHESHLIKKMNIFPLAIQVTRHLKNFIVIQSNKIIFQQLLWQLPLQLLTTGGKHFKFLYYVR